MRKIEIYTASTVRGIRRQNGTAYYMIRSGKAAKLFKSDFYNKNRDGAEVYALMRAFVRALTKDGKTGKTNLSQKENTEEETIVEVYTISNYVRAGFKSLVQWQRGGWKKENGSRIANAEEWETIYRCCDALGDIHIRAASPERQQEFEQKIIALEGRAGKEKKEEQKG